MKLVMGTQSSPLFCPVHCRYSPNPSGTINCAFGGDVQSSIGTLSIVSLLLLGQLLKLYDCIINSIIRLYDVLTITGVHAIMVGPIDQIHGINRITTSFSPSAVETLFCII